MPKQKTDNSWDFALERTLTKKQGRMNLQYICTLLLVHVCCQSICIVCI